MLNFGPSLPGLSDPHESCYKPGTVKVAIYAGVYVPVLVFYSQTIVIHMGIKYAITGFFLHAGVFYVVFILLQN